MKSSQQPFTSKDIFDQFLATQYSTQQEKVSTEKDFGKPLDQYKEQYREVRHLGKGASGSVILVERRVDGE